MWLLEFTFILTVLTIINCFQWVAAILAKQTGRNFWRWYLIAQVLPIISIIILICLWDTNKEQPTITINK